MHTSVSSHLSYYFKDENKSYPNIKFYKEKVGHHKERLSNLLFVNRLLILAFSQFYNHLDNFPVDSGNFFDDMKA